MEAYARLTGKLSGGDDDSNDCLFYITELPVFLGRVQLQDSSLGASIVINADDSLLSRQHAKIQWSQTDGWQMVVLSKNGCTVDKKKHSKDEIIQLHDGSAIRLGHAHLYFTLPIITKSTPSSSGTAKRKSIDTDETGQPEASASGDGAKKKKPPPPYLEMTLAAFESGQIPCQEGDALSQLDVATWVLNNYDVGDIQRQSARKGIYTVLERNRHLFDKVEMDPSTQKKDIVLWRLKKSS
jgi:pSer/pThr/pTyr-binding forkhead associated (FHA) protein